VLDLAVVALSDGAPANRYHATVVVGGEEEEAAAFVSWLLSAEGREAIAEESDRLFGEPLFRAP
jgi:hypothetical protein